MATTSSSTVQFPDSLPEGFLAAFAEKYPSSKTSWAEARQAGDNTDYGTWLLKHSKLNPDSDYAKEVISFKVNPVDATNSLVSYNQQHASETASSAASEPDWDEYATHKDVAAWLAANDWSRVGYASQKDAVIDYYNNIGKPAGDAPKTMGETGGTTATDGTDIPAEEFIGGVAIDRGIADINRDTTERAAIADAMQQQLSDDYTNTQSTIDEFSKVQYNTRKYLEENPDVAKWAQDMVANGTYKSVDEAAIAHYEGYGRTEGRVMQSGTAAGMEEVNRSNQTMNSQLSYLSDQTAAKKAALDTAEKELSVNADKYTAAQKAALEQQIATKRAALSSEIDQKQKAITAEIASLHGTTDTYSQSRQAALTEQLNKLYEVQQPLNDARINAAESQMTAVNLGGETARDELSAKLAEQGYIGSSTGSDMAIARATMGARQQAATIMGNAKVQNAGDIASIGKQGAADKRSILDEVAGLHRDTDYQGANQNYALANYGAEQGKDLSYEGADSLNTIQNTDASNKLNIANFGTQGRYPLDNTAADDTRSIKDSNAQRTLGIFSTDTARRLNMLGSKSTLVNSTINSLGNLDTYRNSGLTNAQNMLNWSKLGSSQAPNAQTSTPVADTTTGDAIASVGSSTAGLIGKYAMSNSFYSPSKVTNTTNNSDGSTVWNYANGSKVTAGAVTVPTD